MRRLAVLLTAVLTACGSAAPLPTPLPATPALAGNVEFEYPQDGTIIYAEALYLSGIAEDVPGDQFIVRLMGAEEQPITQATVQIGSDGKWTAELVHGYSGEPTEMTLFALPSYAGAPPNVDYGVKSIVIAGNSYRPEGVFGSIIEPQDGGAVGGDVLQVSGMVSGVFENTFTLALLGADGTVIDSKSVTANNPYFIDEVPWTAELSTNGYTGPAEIRAFALSPRDGGEILLGSVKVSVRTEAG